MALDSADLLLYARDAASRGEDLYALLAVDATTPKEDIHRAWRKAGLKHHPDKAGASYDAAKYESFERARDVLVDPAAREAYDGGLRAKLEKKRKMDEMSSERRRFVEELERAEREAKRTRRDAREGGPGAEERKRAAEAGRRRMEERARQMREAEERSRMKEREKSREASPAVPVSAATPRPSGPVEETNGTAPPEVPQPESRDEYDEREAEIMRKLAEKRGRRAAKKSRKSDVAALSSRRWGGGDRDTDTDTPVKPPPPDHDATEEAKADGDKAQLPSRPSFLREYAASAPTSPAAGNTSASSSGGVSNFAVTMARLKLAQQKREEEKRRREAGAGAAGGEMQPVSEQQAV